MSDELKGFSFKEWNDEPTKEDLQRQVKQLEQEVKELKSHVEYLVDVVDEVSTATNANMLPQETLDLAANAIATVPEQSLAQHDKEVAIKAINDIASEMNEIYLRDYENKFVKGEQWYWWCRVYKFMKDKVKQLQEQGDVAND